MADFQSFGVAQGRQFEQMCDTLLESEGFTLLERERFPAIGVDVDRAAWSPSGRTIWFEYKGSVRGSRPGLIRTDTLKKAIANGALIHTMDEPCPYVVLASHVPARGAGMAMLERALRAGYLTDVICIYDPADVARLAGL